jgi:hypothetical protein
MSATCRITFPAASRSPGTSGGFFLPGLRKHGADADALAANRISDYVMAAALHGDDTPVPVLGLARPRPAKAAEQNTSGHAAWISRPRGRR